MNFTFQSYSTLLTLLNEEGYKIIDYSDGEKYEKCAILRHDVDFDVSQALLMAQAEYRQGIRSTFFVLVTSNLYNIHSFASRKAIKQIQDMGHTIGLHFDEVVYPEDIGKVDRIREKIKQELDILSEVLSTNIGVYSYHRPSKAILDFDIQIGGAINSYGELFFKKFKYLSDSRMHWREPVLDIICKRQYPRMQILTHPFWYHDKEKSMELILHDFIKKAGIQRYDDLSDNFTDLDGVIDRGGMDRVSCNSPTTLLSMAGVSGKDGQCGRIYFYGYRTA